MIEIIGAPFDKCGRRSGSRLGPEAVRLSGLEKALRSLGLDVLDAGDIKSAVVECPVEGLKHFETAIGVYRELKRAVEQSLSKNHIPLVIGGDHSLAIGSVAAALERFGDSLAVLWIDAHADLNTPGSSRSGNLHGMPAAALLGIEAGTEGIKAAQWQRLASEIISVHLKHSNIGWIGLRDVDSEEREVGARLDGSFMSTMHDVDRYGMARVVEAFDRWMHNISAKALWISFDGDVIDPYYAPGTGTAVRGGLSYREGHLFAELLHELLHNGSAYRLAGFDIVEVNPIYDRSNDTARLAVEWAASLFGKSILKHRSPIKF